MSPLRAITTRLLVPHTPHTHFHTAPALPKPMGGTIGTGRIETNRISTEQSAKTEKTEEFVQKQLPKVNTEEQHKSAEANATYYAWTRGNKYVGC